MTPRAIAVLLLAASTLAGFGQVVAEGPGSGVDGWWRLSDGRLHLVSNASPKVAREMLALLAALRTGVARLAFGVPPASAAPIESVAPITVILFADADEYEPFRIYQRDGQYLTTPFESVVAVNAAAERRPAPRIVAHEYLHALLADAGLALPLWLNEGLAEYYSTALVGDDRLVLGTPVVAHRDRLRGRPFLPLEELVGLGAESPGYLEEGYAERFYAQAWLLVHFLVSEPHSAARLGRLVERLAAGEPVAVAFRTVFGYEPRELDRRLRHYLNRGALPTVSLPTAGAGSVRWTGRVLSADEAAAELAVLAIEQLRWERSPPRRRLAEIWVERALAATPLDGDRLALRARLHEALGERTEAAALYERSLYLDAREGRTFAYYARFLLDESVPVSERAGRQREQALLMLDRALEAVPGHPRLAALRRALSVPTAGEAAAGVPDPARP